VVTKTKIIISGGKRRLFSFLLLEYDFCSLNWIRVDLTPQVQINKQTVKIRFDEPHPYRESISTTLSTSGQTRYKRVIVYKYTRILLSASTKFEY